MPTVDEAMRSLGLTDPRQLRKCLRFADITPTISPLDARKRLLTENDMTRLRVARDTLWPPYAPTGTPPASPDATIDRLAALERRVATLEAHLRASRAPTPTPAEPPISADASEPPPDGVPPGSERLHTFARGALGMSPTTLRAWVTQGGIECVNVPNPTRPGEQERWLTPAGQQQARERLARRG